MPNAYMPVVDLIISYIISHLITGERFYLCFLLRMRKLKPAAAAAKSLQSCPTLCNPIDGSPPGSPVPGILQARTLEWVAISFSIESFLFYKISCWDLMEIVLNQFSIIKYQLGKN